MYTALKLGIVKGNADKTFKPNTSAGEAGMLLQPWAKKSSVSTWAKNQVAFCLKNGILTGDTQKGPTLTQSCTRAQTAVLIRKMLEKANF